MIKKAQWLLKDKKKYSKDYKYILIIYPNICPNMQREVWQTWKLIKRGRWIVRNATFARSKEKRYLLTWPINYPIRADRFGSLPQTLSPCSTLSCNSYIPHAPYPSLSHSFFFYLIFHFARTVRQIFRVIPDISVARSNMCLTRCRFHGALLSAKRHEFFKVWKGLVEALSRRRVGALRVDDRLKKKRTRFGRRRFRSRLIFW